MEVQVLSAAPPTLKLAPIFWTQRTACSRIEKGEFFMKCTKEQKLAMAREHVDDYVPLYQLYEKYGIGGQHAKYFIALYKKHGAKAFEDKGTRTSYTRDFKLECIKRHLYGEENQRKAQIWTTQKR